MMVVITGFGGGLPFELKEERIFSADVVLPLDINDDQVDELLLKRPYSMTVLERRGRYIWDFYFSTPTLKRFVSVADLNQDGRKEIFLNYPDRAAGTQSSAQRQIVEIYSDTGFHLIKRLPTVLTSDRNKDGVWDGYVVGVGGIDANDDGNLDLLLRFSCGFDGQPRGLAVYDIKTEKEIWHYWIGPQIYDVLLEDINGDGQDEIVFGTYSVNNGSVANNVSDQGSYVFVLNRKGNCVWQKKIGDEFTYAQVAVSDIDADGEKEVITAALARGKTKERNKLLILSGKTGRVEKFIETGETFWGLICADLNNDGSDEIVTGNVDGVIRVFNSDLDEIKSYRYKTGIGVFLVRDITGDGRKEIIAGTDDNKLLIFNRKLKKIAEQNIAASPTYYLPSELKFVNLLRKTRNRSGLLITIRKGSKSDFILYSIVPTIFASTPIKWSLIPLFILVLFFGYLYIRRIVISQTEAMKKSFLEGLRKRGYIIINRRGKVLYANQAAAEILGLEGLVGSNIEERLRPKGYLETYHELLQRVHSSKIMEEDRITVDTPEGERVLSFSIFKHLGKKVVLRVEDITQEVHLKRIESWIPVAQKLAHGIKTPLMNIQLSTQQLETLCESIQDMNQLSTVREKTHKFIEGIRAEVKRLRKLTDAIMQFSQLKTPTLTPEDLPGLLRNLGERYKFFIPPGIKIEYNLADSLPKILIDRKEIENALSIILDNSVEAMGKKGILTIACALEHRYEGQIRDWARIEITDTGRGIPERYLDDIFKPYFTYDKPEGTGLGLTLAKSIIENHQGQIEIRSKEGVGTAVFIYLPIK